MSDLLFGRQAVVQIGTEGQEGRSFSDLRVAFSVSMSRSSTPNEATISIWNLSAESVALLQQPDSVVRLFAGYDVPRLVFVGSPVRNGSRLRRDGPDRILEVEAQDGARAWRDATVSVALSGRATFAQVYGLVADQLGLPRGTQRQPTDVDAVAWPDGVTLNGTARDVMDRLARASNSEWFVTDGQLQFVESGGDVGGTALEFSTTAGNLIGAPQRRDDNGIEFTGLLDASVRPGSLLSVVSEEISGVYVAHDVSFDGDTHGSDWYVRVTAYPQGAAPATSSPSTSTPSPQPAQVPASGADTPTDADLFAELSRAIRAGLRVAMPAVVVSYNAAKQTCTAQPTIRAKFETPDRGIEERDYPPIHNCPVTWMQCGTNSIVLPMEAGDEVLLHFTDRSIDEWRVQASGTVSARDPRLHDITDAIAAPVLSRPSNPLPAAAFATGALVIRGTDIRLGDSTASAFVALANLVDARLAAAKVWLDAHLHIDPVSGFTGIPSVPSPTHATVAATKVKAV